MIYPVANTVETHGCRRFHTWYCQHWVIRSVHRLINLWSIRLLLLGNRRIQYRRPNLRILRLLLIALIIHDWWLLVSYLTIVSLWMDWRSLRDLILAPYRIICLLAWIVVLRWYLRRRWSHYGMLGYWWIILITLITGSTTIGNISNTFLIMTIGSL